jgi:hypothetical protein
MNPTATKLIALIAPSAGPDESRWRIGAVEIVPAEERDAR